MNMKKSKISEIVVYILLYGITTIFLPFIFFIILAIVLFPLVIAQNLIPSSMNYTADLLFQLLRVLLAVGIFIIYFVFSNKIIKQQGGPRILLFTVVFLLSAVINFFFSYFICAISVLKPCDPNQYFTISGFFEIFDFYLIVLVSFICSNIYFYRISKDSSF